MILDTRSNKQLTWIVTKKRSSRVTLHTLGGWHCKFLHYKWRRSCPAWRQVHVEAVGNWNHTKAIIVIVIHRFLLGISYKSTTRWQCIDHNDYQSHSYTTMQYQSATSEVLPLTAASKNQIQVQKQTTKNVIDYSLYQDQPSQYSKKFVKCVSTHDRRITAKIIISCMALWVVTINLPWTSAPRQFVGGPQMPQNHL